MIAVDIARDVKEAGGEAYVVGGYVRDLVMGIPSNDIDIEIFRLTPSQVQEILGRYGEVKLVGESFSVFMLKYQGQDIDISLARRERKIGLGHKGFEIDVAEDMTLREASERRNFTVNAMFLDPLTDEIIDLHNGRDDIHNRVLRHVSDKFDEDPLRPWVGARLASKLDFTLDEETIELCRSMIPYMDELPKERIWGEFSRLLLGRKPSAGIKALRRMGWLSSDIYSLEFVQQDPKWHPEGNVYNHTLMALDEMAWLQSWPPNPIPDERRLVMLLAILLHDTGKILTTTRDELGVHSYKHETVADLIVDHFLDEVGAWPIYNKPVKALVREHMMYSNEPSEPLVRRVAKRLGDNDTCMAELYEVIRADLWGRGKHPEGRMILRMWEFEKIAKQLDVMNQAPKRILTGWHLIQLGYEPGKKFGIVLDQVYEEQLDGKVTGLGMALTRAISIWNSEDNTEGVCLERLD